jgi:Zn-dependent peptidase ImmA (M78 family)
MHPSTLLGTAQNQATASFLFRSLDMHSAEDQVALQRMSERLGAAAEILDGLGSFDEWLNGFVHGDTSSGEEAAQNAALFRTRFAEGDLLGPLSRLPRLCVEKSLMALFTMDDLPFDGASAIYKHIPVVFIARRFLPRMLFSLAHEIGHLVSHHFRDAIEEAVGDDFISVDRRVRPSVSRKRRTEQYAHAFASELLMPSQGVGLFLQTLRTRQSAPAEGLGDLEILILSRYYGVSFAVAAMRCEQLALIPAGAAHEFTAGLNKYGKSAEKKAAELGIMPRENTEFPSISPFLVEAAATKIAKGYLSIGRASELLGLSVGSLIDMHSGGGHSVSM